MAANEEDIDIENVDEQELEGQGLSCTDVIFEDPGLISDARGLSSSQWGIYDEQHLFGGEVWPAYEDDDMDPESRATIERMLKEEKHYLQRGSNASKSKSKTATTSGMKRSKPHIVKGIWTDEEIVSFNEGLELFGRQWSKIAEHVGTRTALQVKNYGRNHLKKMASNENVSDDKKPGHSGNEEETVSDKSSTAVPVHSHLPESFETGSTTCVTPTRGRSPKKPQLDQPKKAAKMKHKPKSPSPKRKPKTVLPKSPQKEEVLMVAEDTVELDPTKVNIIEEKTGKSQVKIKKGEAVHLQDASGSEEDVDVDIEDDDDDDFEMGAMNMGVVDNVKMEDNLVKGESGSVLEGQTGILCRELLTGWEPVTSSVHTKVPVMEITKGGKEVIPDQGDSVQLLEQQKQTLDKQVFDDDKTETKPTEVKQDKSNDVTDTSTSTAGNVEVSQIVDSSTIDGDSSEAEDNFEDITPRATEELILEKDIISDKEKLLTPEYFQASTAKTPHRYLTIRNKIIDCWIKCKPSYLTKTAVRPNLRGCGDVNRISAIHSALEHLGAINFGIDNPFRIIISSRSKTRNNRVVSSPQPIVLRPRRKRLCNSEEAKAEKLRAEEAKTLAKVSAKPAKKRKVAYDPFKLMQCSEFTEENVAPYLVTINLSALIVMDLHAHLATTEVIGLLGGDYNETTRVLEITDAKPCKSLSTGMQCEMDPVSQTEASESIMAAGGRVVGWYHSHPTFAPNPSVRDIETQSDLQAWFGPHVPFVGVIVSPYLRRGNAGSTQSVFKCLTISQELIEGTNIGKPYSFSFGVKPDLTNSKNSLLETTKDIINQYSTYPYRTKLLKWKSPHEPNKPYMEKIITSIKSHLSSSNDSESSQASTCDEIVDAIRLQITSCFQDKPDQSSDEASTLEQAQGNMGDVVGDLSKVGQEHDESVGLSGVT